MKSTEPLKSFLTELVARWYECAPYGEQIPDDLPALLVDFARTHAGRDKEAMYDAFCDAAPDDPILRLFECIFEAGASFTISRVADAVYDRKRDILALVDLEPLGTLATPENDPNPDCKHQHVMHPDQDGRMLFAQPLQDEKPK